MLIINNLLTPYLLPPTSHWDWDVYCSFPRHSRLWGKVRTTLETVGPPESLYTTTETCGRDVVGNGSGGLSRSGGGGIKRETNWTVTVATRVAVDGDTAGSDDPTTVYGHPRIPLTTPFFPSRFYLGPFCGLVTDRDRR